MGISKRPDLLKTASQNATERFTGCSASTSVLNVLGLQMTWFLWSTSTIFGAIRLYQNAHRVAP